MEPELLGQTWEFPPELFAKVLSAKTRKRDAPAHELEGVDDIDNYDCSIDSLQPELEMSLRDFDGYKDLVDSTRERDHYTGLANFLNACLTACRVALGNKADDSYYRLLEFFVWDKETSDGISGAHPLKPDLASILRKADGKFSPPDKVFWSPPEDQAQMIVPVEVKDGWKDLVLQAGTYARCLFSASPLRQFTLVLGYEHKKRRLRFLAYHRGGLTASRELDPTAPEGQKDILRLFLSLLTWKSPADAGFPLWCNESSLYLPGRMGGSDKFIADIDSVLHNSTCVRGRSPRVLRAKKRNTIPSSNSDRGELGSLEPVTQTALRRSARLQKISGNRASHSRSDMAPRKSSRPTKSSGQKKSLGSSGAKLSTNEDKPIIISRSRAAKEPLVFVNQAVDWAPESPFLLENNTFAIKFSWALSRGPNNTIIEPHLLRECGGMFGIPKHLYSFRAHHKDACPTTNHLFLPPRTKRKNTTGTCSMLTFILLRSIVHCWGMSFLLWGTRWCQRWIRLHWFGPLFTHISVMTSYYNMCQKNYQHRDISIGNVLMVEQGIKCEPFTIEKSQRNSDEILEGTVEFMSKALLEPNDEVIHSPVDDYWSFYFSAQWACVFRQALLGEAEGDPKKLKYLRSLLTGGFSDRDSGTNSIVDELRRVNYHGYFLASIQAFSQRLEPGYERTVVGVAG
ncbi:hypothetical protein BT96DRAFT_944939 [Gymnopus androsaceus JB14]|uniref:Fungal-type protein kinase domain-containing protein n=1 Tax=Gymnopus androsaceus JB14 TaxID=1447944 RepID=A0A6A4H3S0_9AGAR|nr:hypothetical protein BT96DRAFT_944939 [Gymnopus androsaceus JB14]